MTKITNDETKPYSSIFLAPLSFSITLHYKSGFADEIIKRLRSGVEEVITEIGTGTAHEDTPPLPGTGLFVTGRCHQNSRVVQSKVVSIPCGIIYLI